MYIICRCNLLTQFIIVIIKQVFSDILIYIYINISHHSSWRITNVTVFNLNYTSIIHDTVFPVSNHTQLKVLLIEVLPMEYIISVLHTAVITDMSTYLNTSLTLYLLLMGIILLFEINNLYLSRILFIHIQIK